MRVLLSHCKAIPIAGYGFVPKVIPWNVVTDSLTGKVSYHIPGASFSVLHAYPRAIDGLPTFSPTQQELADYPVPILCVVVFFGGELLQEHILREIITPEDWDWLFQTHGLTQQQLGIIGVTGIDISQTSVSASVNDLITLTAQVLPTHANNQNVVWSVDNNTVVDIHATNNVCDVRAISSGVATITATSVEGGFTAQCVITVN